MFQKKCLGLAEARAAVEAVLDEASKLPDAPIAVAVVDDYGRLVYFARMDGCPPVVVELAINKAYTAAVALLDTLAFAERDKGWGRELATYGDARFTYLQGGLGDQCRRRSRDVTSPPRRDRRQRQDAGRG